MQPGAEPYGKPLELKTVGIKTVVEQSVVEHMQGFESRMRNENREEAEIAAKKVVELSIRRKQAVNTFMAKIHESNKRMTVDEKSQGVEPKVERLAESDDDDDWNDGEPPVQSKMPRF